MKLTTIAALMATASAAPGTPCTNDNRWSPDLFECDQGECCGWAVPMKPVYSRDSNTASKS